MVLSRSQVVMRLIKIRKLMNQKEEDLGVIPDEYHGDLKQEIDQMLLEVIGVPQEGQHQVNTIINRAVEGDIKPKTAVVAVHEIYNDFQNKNNKQQKTQYKQKNKTETADKSSAELEELYQSGYR